MKTTFSVVIRLVIWFILIFGGLFLGIYFDLKFFKKLFFSPVFHIFTFILGIVVLRISIRITSIGGKELAKNGREGDIPRLETNRLVTTGIYSCTRHPMMFGLMFFPLGVALIIGSLGFIIISLFEALLIFVLMIIFDEKEAIKKFGDEYLKYKKEVPIFPRRKCWKKLFKR